MATQTGSGAASSQERAKPRASASDRRERDRDRERGDRPRRRRRRPKPPAFYSEAEINAPDKQTLGYLGVMALMTLILWAFARGGCNSHPPHESRRARAVKTEEFQRDPKSAAVEIFERMAGGNFKSAAELASASATEAVAHERETCESNVAACEERRKHSADMLSSGALLERDQSSATVRVTSEGPGLPKQVHLVSVQREGQLWKVASWQPDTGQFKPKPVSSAPMMPFSITTRQVPAEDVPLDVRQRYEQRQANPKK